jgi:hypothetical protein
MISVSWLSEFGFFNEGNLLKSCVLTGQIKPSDPVIVAYARQVPLPCRHRSGGLRSYWCVSVKKLPDGLRGGREAVEDFAIREYIKHSETY